MKSKSYSLHTKMISDINFWYGYYIGLGCGMLVGLLGMWWAYKKTKELLGSHKEGRK